MKAKAAVRDVGRALNMPYGEVDAIAKAIPFELKMTISKALETSPELKAMYEKDKNVKKILDMARSLEGLSRHASTHAAGVVISKKSINEYVPLYVADKGISTQFTMNTIEELGLLKMDFLGLRNLTVIRDALELIEENHGRKINFSKMDYDDPKVYELISAGNTQGVFQLESAGMTQFMKNLKPDCFEDIVAGISLYRPGPMSSIPTYIENKKNPDQIKYLDESLEPILSVTYGCLVYQEQVMQIVRDLAGYSYGRSDLVRRAMSKKKMDVMLEEQEHFVKGAMAGKGMSEQAAKEIFGQMISFAEYAFNKSHAAAYAVIAYETAYLKVYYPVEFMAALMTSVIGDAVQIARYIRNCNEMQIKVLPPCVAGSKKKFTVAGDEIRFGLLGVKNVGEGVINAIVKMREDKGIQSDIFQFINNIDIQEVNKKAIESLIKAGAFDCINENRAQLMAVYERLIESAQNNSRKNIEGQMSLFQINTEEMSAPGAVAVLPQVANFSEETLITLEKEMLGVYITGHPLKDYEDKIEKVVTITSEELSHAEANDHVRDGMKATMAGIISSKKMLVTKSGSQMAFLELEDLYGIVEVIVFPKVYERCVQSLMVDNIIVVKGTINFKEDEQPKLMAEKIIDLKAVEEVIPGKTLKINIPQDLNETQALQSLKEMLTAHKGDMPVIIKIERTGKKFKASSDLWVENSPLLMKKLEEYGFLVE